MVTNWFMIVLNKLSNILKHQLSFFNMKNFDIYNSQRKAVWGTQQFYKYEIVLECWKDLG